MSANTMREKLALWGVDPGPREPAMLLDFIEELAQHQPVPPAPRSAAELEQRREPLQRRLRHSLGLLPWPERTDLKVRTTGVVIRRGYRIEKLVYEAWPGLPVTAHLYLPEAHGKPAPGLVYACGHWMEAGKLAPPVQSFCATAAGLLGIVTLVYDPIGQGERLGSWRDHGHLNALLVGRSQLGLMVWESIRALDLLERRPEVDGRRIAITGASGGGLNTLFTAAVEDRFCCAIPAAYPCTFFHAMHAERDLNWEDGTDVCNQVPQVMSYAEMSDIASLFIPKPYMILTGTRDRIFPVEGTRRIAAEIQRNYELAGVPERFRFVEYDEEHGYQTSLREAAYGWLAYWLAGVGDGSPIEEPELELFDDPYPVHYAEPPLPTPGRVRDQSPTLVPTPGSLSGFCLEPSQRIAPEAHIDRLLQQDLQRLPAVPPLPERAPELALWQEEIRQRVRIVLGPFPPSQPLHTRLFNQVWADGLMAERVTFVSEKGITVPGMLIMPAEWNKPVPMTLYIGEWGKRQGIQSGLIKKLLNQGIGVLAIDVRGVGETATSDFEAATNLLMMDRPLFGQRVWDTIRGVDFLWERCYIAPQIDKGRLFIAGEGVGGLLALYATALDGRVAGAIALDIPLSYTALLPSGALFPASVYLFDVLRHYDLPHVVAACAPRPVLIRPVDGFRRPCRVQECKVMLDLIARAYQLADAGAGAFGMLTIDSTESLSHWLSQALA